MKDLISVIVPVYKVEKYLSECIDSIINQSYTNLEIILVDDGSPDSCPKICDEYARKDARVRVIHKENGGVSSARNAGLEIAQGEYVMFVDSDDFLDPSYCTSLISCMTPETDMVVFGMNLYSSRKEIIKIPSYLKTGYYKWKDLGNDIIDRGTMSGFLFPSTCTILYRNTLLQKDNIRFDSNIHYNEDGFFNVMYYFLCKPNIYVDFSCTLYFYRMNNESATNNINTEKYDRSMQLIHDGLQKIARETKEFDIETQLSRRYVTLKLIEIIRNIQNYTSTYKDIKIAIKDKEFVKNLKFLQFHLLTKKRKILYLLLKLKAVRLLMYCLQRTKKKK